MPTRAPTFPLPGRPLTPAEEALVRAMLERFGDARARGFLEQLPRATVVRGCRCGCASVDFAIDGIEPEWRGGMEILVDLISKEPAEDIGVFVFAHHDRLAGLEIWSPGGANSGGRLPSIEELADYSPVDPTRSDGTTTAG